MVSVLNLKAVMPLVTGVRRASHPTRLYTAPVIDSFVQHSKDSNNFIIQGCLIGRHLRCFRPKEKYSTYNDG